jgi:hypothetical protein
MIVIEEINEPIRTAVFTMTEMSELRQDLEILLQVFPDGQVHIAFRGEQQDPWSPGVWSILTQ